MGHQRSTVGKWSGGASEGWGTAGPLVRGVPCLDIVTALITPVWPLPSLPHCKGR